MSSLDLSPTIGKQIRLCDGRWLGYAEYGDPAGKPIFYFHGSASSRLERHPDESIVTSLGARIIAIDRPGHGLSDFKPGRKLLDWPDDVVELADTLGIDRFAVMGMSAGGPYALACSYKIADRLTAAAIISSLAPYDRPGATDGLAPQFRVMLRMAKYAPWLARLFMGLQARTARRSPERVWEQMGTAMAKPDQAVIAQPDIKAVLIEMFAEAYRAGGHGPAWEFTRILVRPWGFRLEDITMEVHLWHGEEDLNTPLQWGQYLASAIPNCHATFLAGEGHLLIFNHLKEILTTLLS